MIKRIEDKRGDGVRVYYAPSIPSWRAFLSKATKTKLPVWLVLFKKGTNISSISINDAIDHALCYGYVDSKANKRDNQSYYQYFAARSPKSNWSKVNKEKVARLQKEGLMHETGLELVRLAKEKGTWDALADVDNLIEPKDLLDRLNEYPNALKNWKGFPPSTRRGILEWIFNAKRPPTRQKRINETAQLAENNIRANQYNPK